MAKYIGPTIPPALEEKLRTRRMEERLHVTVSLQLNIPAVTRLDWLCQRTGLSRSAMIRECIDRVFTQMKAKAKTQEAPEPEDPDASLDDPDE